MSYQFIDAYSSVLTADSSVISGSTLRPVVQIGSALGVLPISGPVTLSGTPSVSGTVGASIIGQVEVFNNSRASVISGNASTLGTASVLVIGAAGAGLKNYITDILVSNTGAATTLVTFTDGDASILGKTIAPTTGGSNIINMSTPMKTPVNQPFNATPATATSVLHLAAYGYKAP